MKFVVQWIIGPLTGSALLGLAWLSYNDVQLYADLSHNARAVAYAILMILGSFGVGKTIVMFTSLFEDIGLLDPEDREQAHVQDKALELKKDLSRLGFVVASMLSVFLFFAILDGIADSRSKTTESPPGHTQSPDQHQNP